MKLPLSWPLTDGKRERNEYQEKRLQHRRTAGAPWANRGDRCEPEDDQRGHDLEDMCTLSHEIAGNPLLINADENDLDELANQTANIVRNLREIEEAETNLVIGDQAAG